MTNREKIIDALGGLVVNGQQKLTEENHHVIRCPYPYPRCPQADVLDVYLAMPKSVCVECKNNWLNEEAADFGIKPEDIIAAVEDSSRKITGFELTFMGKDHVDMSPCFFCKHRDKMTVSAPCYSCIDTLDLALHKPNAETEFSSFKPISAAHAAVLQFEMNGGKQK